MLISKKTFVIEHAQGLEFSDAVECRQVHAKAAAVIVSK
jgi:hypothetical protein